jgi:hypothetical protein
MLERQYHSGLHDILRSVRGAWACAGLLSEWPDGLEPGHLRAAGEQRALRDSITAAFATVCGWRAASALRHLRQGALRNQKRPKKRGLRVSGFGGAYGSTFAAWEGEGLQFDERDEAGGAGLDAAAGAAANSGSSCGRSKLVATTVTEISSP